MKREYKQFVAAAVLGVITASLLGLTGDQILQNVYDSVNTALRVNVVAGGGGIISGTTTCTGCTNNALLKSNGSGKVVSSSVTDDETTVSTTEPLKSIQGGSSAGLFSTSAVGSDTFADISIDTGAVDIELEANPSTARGTSLDTLPSSTVLADYSAAGHGLIILGGTGPLRFGTGGYAASNEAWDITTSGNLTSVGAGRNLTASGVIQGGIGGSNVNGVTITGAATGVGPTIAAVGETNVDLNLAVKGSGTMKQAASKFQLLNGVGGTPFFQAFQNVGSIDLASSTGLGWVNSGDASTGTEDLKVWRGGAAILQLGPTGNVASSNTSVTQTIKAFDAASGNNNGSNLVLTGGNKAGSGQDGVPVLGKGYLVSTLPLGTPVDGSRAWVTDQLTTCAAIGVAPTGGGSVHCPVFFNGSAWVSG